MLIDLALLPFHPRLQTNNTHYVYYYMLFISFFRYAVEVVSKLFSFAGSLKGYILLHTRVRSLGAVRYVELGASRLTAIAAVVRSPFSLRLIRIPRFRRYSTHSSTAKRDSKYQYRGIRVVGCVSPGTTEDSGPERPVQTI